MRRFAAFFVLAACAAPPASPVARPEAVILYRDALTVLMSDGTLCVSDRPGRAEGWSGTLQGCPHGLAVSVESATDAPREVLRPGGDRVFVAGQGWG